MPYSDEARRDIDAIMEIMTEKMMKQSIDEAQEAAARMIMGSASGSPEAASGTPLYRQDWVDGSDGSASKISARRSVFSEYIDREMTDREMMRRSYARPRFECALCGREPELKAERSYENDTVIVYFRCHGRTEGAQFPRRMWELELLGGFRPFQKDADLLKAADRGFVPVRREEPTKPPVKTKPLQNLPRVIELE